MINANLSGATNQATRRGEIEGLQWPDYYDGELLAAIRVNCFVNFLRLWTRFDDPLPLDLPLYLMEGETFGNSSTRTTRVGLRIACTGNELDHGGRPPSLPLGHGRSTAPEARLA